MIHTYKCKSFLYFLGAIAPSQNVDYTDNIAVYALSARNPDEFASTIANTKWIDLWLDNKFDNTNDVIFTKASSAKYMCYNFKLSNVETESDNEPDAPYSYEEMLNQNVQKNISASTGMQYNYIYSAYQGVYDYSNRTRLMNNFAVTNNMASTTDFVRSDYYKFFVPETEILHNRTMLTLNDDTMASVGNTRYEPFNCVMYCVNPIFDNSVIQNRVTPIGFEDNMSIIPISITTFDNPIMHRGDNVIFEPNLNGIVTAE